MSVADLLQQMAQNAGGAQLRRGAIYGDLVAAAAHAPAEFLADRDRERQLQEQRARQQAQDTRAAAADKRQADADAREQAMQAETLKKQTALKAGIAAGFGDNPDPKAFDLGKAAKTVTDAGYPDLITTISDVHDKLQPKITRGAPGSVATGPDGRPIPGSEIPAPPTTAGNEAAIRGLYAKRASGQALTPAETAQITGYETEKGANDAPITVRTMENGKPVEKVMTRAQALAAGSFPSQPPASVIAQNAPPPPAQPPSKAEIAMANYMVPTPSPRSFATPAGKAMMDRILTVNPDFDASLYSVRAPTRKAYTTGPQGQQLTAMNTAIEHLDQLQAAADALQNGSFKPGNAAFNYLKDTFGESAPTTFATIKEKVDKELDAVASKGVPTVSGAAAQKQIGGVDNSPKSVSAYIDASIKLLGSSQNALRAPYVRVMGANAPFDPLTPQAKAILVKRGFDPETGQHVGDTTPSPTLAPGATHRVMQNGVTYDVTTDAAGKIISAKPVQP